VKTANRRRSEKRPRRRLFSHFPKVSGKMAEMEVAIEAASAKEQPPVFYLVVMLFVIAVVTGAFVYHLHVRFEGVWLGYETSRARAEKARLLVERRELRLEMASLKSPDRVELEATEKLGMHMPDHDQIVPIGKQRKQVLASGRPR
jgi:cell division protein FtsL